MREQTFFLSCPTKEITTQPIKLRKKANRETSKRIKTFVDIGKIVSLINNLRPSANGCNKPK